MTDNEKRAHDLALLYNLILTMNPDTDLLPQELIANYQHDYSEFLKLLSD